MRADRLVATLLLLQARGQVTAGEVARELEVSERTARRDLEGLAMAGLPVYSVAGRNGGWRLLGDGRTDLTGLTASEVRALFLVAGTAQASPDVRAALRKLTSALPEPFRAPAESAATALVIDRPGWRGDAPTDRPPPPHLDAVQEAVVEGREVVLGYVARDSRHSQRTVQPLGLVSKGVRWYLVADTADGLRTFRIDRIASVQPTGRGATRPEGFDLQGAWQLVRERVATMSPEITATGWADPSIIGVCRHVMGHRLSIGPPAPGGRIPIEITERSVEALVGQVAGFGAGIEIVEPATVRAALATVGRELTVLYRTSESR